MFILGISAFYHDSAACILKDGEIIAAAQEERFTRKKHDQNFPINAIKYCLKEAEITAKLMGVEVESINDVGVTGIHRILNKVEQIRNSDCIVVVAGMEGALPTVVAGLVDKPVIAVPTSIGFGTGEKGYSALLTMLNSCAPGISVVNIDAGFSAGYQAALIARK